MIVNPLRPVVRKVLMVNGNPEEEIKVVKKVEWQGWGDKAVISLLLACGVIFTEFLFGFTYEAILENLPRFCYQLIRKFGSVFFTNFLILTGLTEIAKRRNNNDN